MRGIAPSMRATKRQRRWLAHCQRVNPCSSIASYLVHGNSDADFLGLCVNQQLNVIERLSQFGTVGDPPENAGADVGTIDIARGLFASW